MPYLGPSKTIRDVAAILKHGALDPLRDFSNACLDEFRLQVLARDPDEVEFKGRVRPWG